MSNSELQALRAELDQIDIELVDILARRFEVTARVGKIKARHSLQAIDQKREAAQIKRYRELAEVKKLNPEVVLSIFRTVINEVVKNHLEA